MKAGTGKEKKREKLLIVYFLNLDETLSNAMRQQRVQMHPNL